MEKVEFFNKRQVFLLLSLATSISNRLDNIQSLRFAYSANIESHLLLIRSSGIVGEQEGMTLSFKILTILARYSGRKALNGL